ncbi:hypothetical protein QQP08_027353 [Theobroma cacao]|nr:hypothetical protein QQP08_027353 [Theobroma cacao]
MDKPRLGKLLRTLVCLRAAVINLDIGWKILKRGASDRASVNGMPDGRRSKITLLHLKLQG